MKMTYLGIQRIQGYKKANGDPFDMAILYVQLPIEPGSFGKTDKKTVITGFGCKPAEIEADVNSIPLFSAILPGTIVDLETDQRFFAGELKTFITGVRKAPLVSKVA